MELWRFEPGDLLLTYNGAKAEVLAPTEDGRWIRVRYLESPKDPSLIGAEDLMADREVSAFSPAPPGPEWADRIVVVLHHVPESEATEEGYEAVTMGGTPMGVSIAASASDTAQEALDRLIGALGTFGYTGTVAVEDATATGVPERYEVEIGAGN